MRFALATQGGSLEVYKAFAQADWQLVKLFTQLYETQTPSQVALTNYAAEHDAAIQVSKITAADLAALGELECDALIVSNYKWKVPHWRPHLQYAVNFHPSPLPEARGTYPLPQAVLEQRSHWGITCHKISDQFDRGDILDQELFALHASDCHESLQLKLQMANKRLAGRIAASLPELWLKASPQTKGSYWKKPGYEIRVLDFNEPVERVLSVVKAFGSLGTYAHVWETWVVVKRALGWPEPHDRKPGEVAYVNNASIVIAVADGYVALVDHMLGSLELQSELKAWREAAEAKQPNIDLEYQKS